ncbi:MAG TPA: ABC transporter permease [Thermomicrobiaceae bacterium]|nr:ABC transporter permease [Thermomicrobiaceae bacterium]
MGSIVTAAWRLVLERARSDRLILGAAVVTILLATTLLAAGPIYASAVAESGLRRMLRDAPVQQADIQVSVDSTGRDYPARDARVTAVAQGVVAPVGGRIERSLTSTSFALPNQPPDGVHNLMVFASFALIQQHAHLVAGAWPAPGGSGVIEAAIPRPTAELLGLSVGSTLRVTNRLDASLTLPVRISGLYLVDAVADPYWWGDPLETGGVEVGSSFTTYGPFVVDQQTFFGPLSSPGATYTWRIFPNFAVTTVPMVPTLIANVDGLTGSLNQGYNPNDQFLIDTQLNTLLRQAQRSLLVTRTGVLIVTVQLAMLAGYALLLTSGLLVDQRRVETGLLHARGASTAQIVTMALMEALLLGVPAAAIGPWLADLSLRILNHIGPLATIGLTLHPKVTPDAYWLSILAALGCVLALALPSLAAARSFVQARTARGRQRAQGLAQRAGIDVALLGGAALGYWQLHRYGAPITETVQGKLGLDPLLVAAPALGLVAGAVVALRIIPLLARVVDRAAGRLRGLVPALGAWQLGRRPLGYSRSALLLMLALAIGLFSLAYGSTWSLSQRDQGNYQVGADLRLQPDIRYGSAIPQFDLAQVQGQVRGVTATMPVMRDYFESSQIAGEGRLLGVDAAQAARIVTFRPDLASVPLSTLMAKLAAGRPTIPTLALPGRPQRLALDVSITLDPLPAGAGIPASRADIFPYLTLVVRDARGMLYTLGPTTVPADGTAHRVVFPLAYAATGGVLALPQYPVTLASASLEVHPLQHVARTGLFTLLAFQTSDQLTGNTWSTVPFDRSKATLSMTQFGLSEAASTTPAATQPAAGTAFQFNSGAARGNGYTAVSFDLKPSGPLPPQALPVLVSNDFLNATATHVGDTIPLDLEGARRMAHIVGAVGGFPTLDPSQPNVILDLPTLEALKFESDGGTLDPSEWWLSTTPGGEAAAAATLQATPYSSPQVINRLDRIQTLRTDPVALGIIGALSLGFVAAGLFAALGFAVSAAVGAWDRLTEFALLRALGLSPGQLSGWLSLESGILVVVSLVGGTALGLLLAWLILPLVSLTQQASQTVPGVIVVVPWSSVAVLEVSSLAVLALAVVVLAAALRRIGLGSLLRLGEE